MNTPDDHDEVSDLLREGYAADADPGFAASLLTRLQEEMKPRRRHRWMVMGAVAAAAAIVFGIVGIIFFVRARPSSTALVEAPTGEVGRLVVRGRILKWDAPIAEFAVSQMIHGTVDAATIYVDLSRDLDAMRRHVREGSTVRAARTLRETEIAARAATLFATQLNLAAGTDMVLELGPRREGGQLERRGLILNWGGVPDLPPRDRHYDMADTIINVVAGGSASALQPHPGDLLRDEWGMPR